MNINHHELLKERLSEELTKRTFEEKKKKPLDFSTMLGDDLNNTRQANSGSEMKRSGKSRHSSNANVDSLHHHRPSSSSDMATLVA